MFIHVKVRAGSKKEEFNQKSDHHFEISIREKAERNMANNKVVELVANYFSLPKSRVRIINGHHSPSKLLSINEERI